MIINLLDSKQKAKQRYDKTANPIKFKTGDYVYLLIMPKPKKLEPLYSGPHKILEIIYEANVKIEVGNKTMIVHANRLRISHINPEDLKD